MIDIKPASNRGCLERGISTMRLALGYDDGLPRNWLLPERPTRRDTFAEVEAMLHAFPCRRVIFFLYHEHLEDEYLERCPSLSPQNFLRPDDIGAIKDEDLPRWYDDYLWGFCYKYSQNNDWHFVIGAPCSKDDVLEIRWAIAVSIAEDYGKITWKKWWLNWKHCVQAASFQLKKMTC